MSNLDRWHRDEQVRQLQNQSHRRPMTAYPVSTQPVKRRTAFLLALAALVVASVFFWIGVYVVARWAMGVVS